MSSVEEEIQAYEKRTGQKLPAHNRGTLRAKIERENRWWDEEEKRTLLDSNRYHDDN